MMAAPGPHQGRLKEEIRFRDVLFLALSAGAITGILEGAGLYAFQADRWVGRGFLGTTATLPILYLSPLFNMLVFGGAALLLQAVFFALRIAAEARACLILGAMCFLAFFDWLVFSERFSMLSAIVLALGLAAAAERWLRRGGQRTVCRSAGKIFAAFAAAIALLALGIVPAQRQAERAARAALPPPPAGAPNIVLLILDTTRADHMSVYGYGRKTTPFLERLAAEGTVFDNAVATSSWTLPSHVSMLTGRYPREHGAVLNAYDGRYPSVASSFDRLGYLTAGFSANLDWFASGRGMAGGFQHFEDDMWSVASMFARTGYGTLISRQLASATGNRLVLGAKRAEDVNRTALRWLDSAPKRPFFLVLNYYDANSGGALPSEPYRRLFSDQPLAPPAGSGNEFRSADVDRTRSDEYDGSLSYMDACARELLESLRRRGLAENLILVVAADHGDLLGEHGLLGHRNALYWDLIRVPLIFWRASGLPRGLRIERPVSLVSLPATLLELAGQSDPGGFPAPSLAQLWRAGGDAGNWPFPMADLAQMPYPGLEQNLNFSGALSAIVTPRWLLIHHSAHGPALYDWTRDPENLHNLARGCGVDGVSAALVDCLRDQGSAAGGANCQADLAGKLELPSAAGDPAVIGQQ